MKTFILSVFIFISFQTFAQFDYNLYIDLISSENLHQNSKIDSVVEYQLEKKGKQTKRSMYCFLENGFPSSVYQSGLQTKKIFIYESPGKIKSIETYKAKRHESSTEFQLNELGQIVSYIDYGYSTYDDEKLFIWKTFLEYNPNGSLKRTTQTQGNKRDTVKTEFYNILGVKTKELWNMGGLKTKKIEYVYNNDSTEMLEKHYESDTAIYTTVIHRYKNKKEIELIDPSTWEKPFYWKYDKLGKVIETNENLFFVTLYTYNDSGYLIKKTWDSSSSVLREKGLPKKINFIYTYKFR